MRKLTIAIVLLAAVIGLGTTDIRAQAVRAQAKPAEIRLDYSFIVPASLVVKRNGWLEQEFKADGIPIHWVLSQGSNRALEYMNAGSLDLGATSGLSALVGRANGVPLKTVYVELVSNQLGILVLKDSPIRSVAELKGKKIASFKGTMPYFFLLSTLRANGISKSQVEIVHLPFNEGQLALESKRVDAWSGQDPFSAATQINAGSRQLAAQKVPDFGVLNTTEAFARQYPDQLKRILQVFERARLWIIAHPEETAKLIAEEGKQTLPVARLQLAHHDYRNSVPGDDLRAYLKQLSPLLVEEDIVRKNTNLDRAIGELIDPSFAKAVVGGTKR
jgi:sulfonate transport system substrate-binding protein